MKNSKHQVVILKNLTSPYIYQAILVLKDNEQCFESQVITDAEKIIDDYLRRTEKQDDDIRIYTKKSIGKKKTQERFVLGIGLFCLCVIGYLFVKFS